MTSFVTTKMSGRKDVIASGNHPTSALNKMKSLREKSALCDITLKIADTEIPSHKVVLAASSPYFEFMFTGNVKERTKECIEIGGFCPKAFLTVVNFMYSGYLVVNEETMLDVLKVADFLKISSAKEECLKYVQEHIKLTNCIIIWDIAKEHYFTELEAKVNTFIENNFVEFINTECFFQLSVDEVKFLITGHRSYTDDSLYEKAISNWIDYEEDSREGLMEDLLGSFKVHVQSLKQNELNVYNSLLAKRIYVMDCKGPLDEVVYLDLKNLKWNCVSERPKFDSIPPIFHNDSVYVIGNDKCGRLDMELEEWEIRNMPFRNDYTAGCSVHNGIYLIMEGPSKGTFCYNTETNVLFSESQLIRARSYPGVAFSENCLYVCGGGFRAAERRDLRTKIWRSISHLPKSVHGACSATSLHDRIYLTSASTGEFFEFDKRNGVWIEKAKIPKFEDRSLTLGSTDEAVYSYNGTNIYRYNTNGDKWEFVESPGGLSSIVCVYPR